MPNQWKSCSSASGGARGGGGGGGAGTRRNQWKSCSSDSGGVSSKKKTTALRKINDKVATGRCCLGTLSRIGSMEPHPSRQVPAHALTLPVHRDRRPRARLPDRK